MKRIKTTKNYAETKIAISKKCSHVEHSETSITTNIVKTALKLEASLAKVATYYFFSSIKGNA